MTSAWSQLEQMLTCAICLDKFKNPRLLPCQHSFCGDSCMEGLVDYARRQIKCPECRAEHRIPYQGVSSLPCNVTLIRFLELHAKITGEEPEPVPTFLEKCSICGEKVDGVQRCAHCDKKVCPECKEAHIDILRREIGRINSQSKRCLNKMQEFKEVLVKSEERLSANFKSVKSDIEQSCSRLIEDLKAKQARLLSEVESFNEAELKTINKLKSAIKDELEILDSNSQLADDKLCNAKYQWTDQELSEFKEIYAKSMEFVRLFDPEIGDFTRKIRFTLLPEFETLRRRICELGELKFSESAAVMIANSFQYCNATGAVAIELCNSAQLAVQAANTQGGAGYNLSHSNSNSNLGPLGSGGGSGAMLELPSMQNALMRSQSDHRLATQFQLRLKQQQQLQQDSKTSAYADRYGGVGASSRRGMDYETDSLRSRYAPPRSSASAAKDNTNDLLRDWPRPGDSDPTDLSFGSSIQFKSAFMRRKEKERQALGSYSGASSAYGQTEDDDDLASEASYGGMSSSRNVRFHDNLTGTDPNRNLPKVFDCKELEHAPLSGVPKLADCAQLHTRLHQMGAKAVVDKKIAEEEGKRDKDLVESAREAMSKAKRLAQRQMSEDDIEKQKRTNKQPEVQQQIPEETNESFGRNRSSTLTEDHGTRESPRAEPSQVESPRHSPTPTADLNSSASTVIEMDSRPTINSQQTSSPGSPSASSLPGGRRSLYGQAVTEKSKRQLTSAIQDAANYTSRRRGTNSSADGDQTPDSPNSSSASGTKARRTLRSTGRSLSKQNSIDPQQSAEGSSPGTPTSQRRRRTLARAESSQISLDTSASQQQNSPSVSDIQSKNYSAGSGGHSEDANDTNLRSSQAQDSLTAARPSSGARSGFYSRASTGADQTSTTTDDEAEFESLTEESARYKSEPRSSGRSSSRRYTKDSDEENQVKKKPNLKSNASNEDQDDEADGGQEDDDDEDDDDSAKGSRGLTKRSSRELLPKAMNKLLDRSAQIRRDSQETRSRADSPKRSSHSTSTSATGLRDYSGPSQSSYYSSSRPAATTSGYSSPSSGSGVAPSTRQRLAYQRSQSIRDEETTNSSNSIYTTASSVSGRHSSVDDDELASGRRASGNSTDRTLTYDRPSAYSRRESSGNDSPASSSGYQSRFLSRSRTSTALSSNRSQDNDSGHEISREEQPMSAARSYLSSRDRFMQSAAAMSSGATSSAPSGSGSGSGSSSQLGQVSSSLYSRSGSGPSPVGAASVKSSPSLGPDITAMGQFRHQPTSPARYCDNTPFIELDDEADDEYSAYFPSGVKSHSEYLRNKFSGRTSSNSSSSSLLRSRSNHSTFDNRVDSNDDDEDDDNDNDDDGGGGETRGFGSRKSSLIASNSNSDSTSTTSWSRSSTARSLYSSKGRMLFKLGSRGSDPGKFTWPRGVAVGLGSRGPEIVVADSSNHRVQVFNSSGGFLREFGAYGSEAGEFDCLAGVAIDRLNKNYIVSDRYNHRIQIFDFEGRFVRSFGEIGADAGKFNLPWGVAVDNNGIIYVCDKENHRVQMFDSDGLQLNKFGVCGSRAGQMHHPHYLAVGNNKVVVTDTNNHRLQVFDSSGRLMSSIGAEGSANGQFKFPRGVAMDDSGYIIVGDSGNNRLQVFAPDGSFLKAIGSWGSGEGEFKGIEGVAVDGEHRILVCDRENHRIQVF